MNHTRLLFLSVLPCAQISAISMVYNFRIAQITKQPIVVEGSQERNKTVIGLLFDQYRKKYQDSIHQNFVGALGSFIYDFEPYYFRVDAAVSHIHETTDHTTTFSGTEADDILFTGGRTIIINDDAVMTFSGLFGVPTHKILRLQHVDFGYSQVGIGIQWDGSYEFRNNNAFLYGARYIYFVPRHATDSNCQRYNFTLGNVGDILAACKKNWSKHGVEGGYTFRSRFGARICPSLDNILQKTNYLRSNFYFVYKYRFLINNIANRFLLNIAYGFDHKSKIFGNKVILTVWGSWNVRF